MTLAAKPRSGRVLAFATATAFLLLLGLGIWQLERRSAKHAFIDALAAAAVQDPVPLPPRENWDSERDAFRRVRASGRYLPDANRFVHTTVPAGGDETAIGFFVVTPLVLDRGGTLFVNRGTVSAGPGFKPPPVAPPVGLQTVTGYPRPPERASLFLPADSPERGDYFRRDPDALNATLGLSEIAPFILDAERGTDESGPRGLDPAALLASIPDNHLQYAFTWFGLASALAGVYVALLRARRADKGRPAEIGLPGRGI